MDLMDYRRKIIANSPHLSSASGAVATFSDGADLPLKSLNVDIEPVQSGTGDPSPTNIRPISGWDAVNVKNGNTVIATISLGQTVYGGTLNPLTGVLTLTHKGYAITDVSALIADSGATAGFRVKIEGVHVKNDTTPAQRSSQMCSHAPIVINAGNIGANTGTSGAQVHPTSSNLYFYLLGYDTLEDTKTYCQSQITAGTPVTFVYPLATPVTIQLTPQQIRSLYGNNTIFADTGNVALEYWAHA